MRTTRRNIPDPISPQNPVIQKDVIDSNRIQNELEEQTSVEDIYTDDTGKTEKRTKNKTLSIKKDSDTPEPS
jgi:hypothetical protein